MNRWRRTTRTGFTLLESIIALAMIGAVAGACLQVRAQSLAGQQRLTVHQKTDRGIETILRLAQSGLLENPQRERDETGDTTLIVWTGEHLDEPFTCRRDRIEIANPISGATAEQLPENVTLWRWTVTYKNESAETLTPTGPTR